MGGFGEGSMHRSNEVRLRLRLTTSERLGGGGWFTLRGLGKARSLKGFVDY